MSATSTCARDGAQLCGLPPGQQRWAYGACPPSDTYPDYTLNDHASVLVIRELNAQLTVRLRLICRVSVGEGGDYVVEARDESLDVFGGQLRRAAARSQLTLQAPSALHSLGDPPAHEGPGLGLSRQDLAVAFELTVALRELAAQVTLLVAVEGGCLVAYGGQCFAGVIEAVGLEEGVQPPSRPRTTADSLT